MKKPIFAILDSEVSYAYHFMEYLSQKKNIPFEIQIFTSLDPFKTFVSNHEVTLLLVADHAFSEELKELVSGKIIILSEGSPGWNPEEYPSIYKYQSSDTVIREVMAIYGESDTEVAVPFVKGKKAKVIGVYSPIGRTMKTSLALTIGQILAEKKSTLYINLEAYSGFEEIFQMQYEGNISDLMFYHQQKNPKWKLQMMSTVQTIGKLEYIPPVVSPMDIQNIPASVWREFLVEMIENSSYEVVVLDMGNCFDEISSLLELCDLIYMPVQKDYISKAKIKQFENLMRMWDCIPVLEKIKKIYLPNVETDNGSFRIEQLVWSEFGENVRKILSNDIGHDI